MKLALGSFPRVAVLALDTRHPDAFDRVAALVASKGGPPAVEFLNGEGVPGIDPARYRLRQDRPAPIGWRGSEGAWRHFRAFRAAVAQALADDIDGLLVVEDDLDFTPEFDAVLGAAEVPDDWDLVYLGANHSLMPTEEVNAHVLRLHGSFCVHCVAIRPRAFAPILAIPPVGPMDWSLGTWIHPAGRSYAVWPSVAIQRPGFSSSTGRVEDYRPLFLSRGSNW